MTEPLLSVEGLEVSYPGRRRGDWTAAVRDVSLHVSPGEVLCIIGESGSGKSTVLSAIAGLLPDRARVRGRMHLAGRRGNILAPGADRSGIAGRQVGMVFQNPAASLNPVLSIGAHVAEVIRAHRDLPEPEVRALSIDYLARVGLPDPARRARDFPHQLSGGRNSAWPSPPRLPAARACCWPTNRRPRWTPRCRHRSSTCCWTWSNESASP